MKFGPSPLSYDLVMELLYKSGLESLATFSIADQVELSSDLGFSHFEIALDIFQTFPIPITQDELTKLKTLKHQKSLSFSCHLPFFSLDLAVSNQYIREGTQNAFINAYKSLRDLEKDIDCYVIHPIGENTTEMLRFMGNFPISSAGVDLCTQYAIQGIQILLKETGINPNKIAIENLKFPLESTLGIIKETST